MPLSPCSPPEAASAEVPHWLSAQASSAGWRRRLAELHAEGDDTPPHTHTYAHTLVDSEAVE